MQNRFQHTFTKSKMNKDLDARLIANDEYRDGVNISVSRAEADDVGALENILGNSLISSIASSSPFLMQTIGWYFNPDNDKLYLFDTNYQDNSNDQISSFAPVGSLHRIIVVDPTAQTFSVIVQGRFLNFSWNSPILDIAILENLMFWTDFRNQPRVINIKTAEANTTYYNNEDHVSVAKYYPYKPIQLTNEQVGKAGWINDNNTHEGAFDGLNIYNFFLVAKSGTPTYGVSVAFEKIIGNISYDSNGDLKTFAPNIGLQGYVKGADNNLWDFKVANVEVDPTGSTYPSPYNGGYKISIDRDLSNALALGTGDGGAPTNPSKLLYLIDQTSKNVSSPWLDEDQVKLEVKSVSSSVGGLLVYSNTAGAPFAQALYAKGTNTQASGLGTDVFKILNHFPKNDNPTGTAPLLNSTGFPRIMSPKLDPLDYYVVTGLVPVDGSGSSGTLGFSISKLSGFVDGELTSIAPDTILAGGDLISIHWPNKFYNYEFPGDSNFLKEKFVRFAYRFKYDDGQYSLISPFTQSVFIPKQKGYFLKKIGKQKTTGISENNYVPQENTFGENTINDFMVNEITQSTLKISTEYNVNQLADKLKVSEIDILYKESDTNNIMVVETLKVTDSSITQNSSKFIEYVYQSRKPIKTLRSAETTRVYDLVPTRAKTLSSAGNRIIYGNFFDRPTSPLGLTFFACANQKFTPATTTQVNRSGGGNQYDQSPFLPNKYSNVSYPNSSLKQNRNYQVGIVLQDRYGRSSDVILSNFSETNFTLRTGSYEEDPLTFFGSTLFHEYLPSVISPLTPYAEITQSNKVYSGIVNWPGDSLKVLFVEQVPRSVTGVSGYPGLYKDPFVTSTMANATISPGSYINVPTGGIVDSVQPGMEVFWTVGLTEYSAFVQSVTVLDTATTNRINLVNDAGGSVGAQGDNIIPAFPNTSVFEFYEVNNPIGWYSYKIVVKQTEQDYYNVYLPSLLDGAPVIKPFSLNVNFTINSNVANMQPIGDMEYLTFPLLAGMKLVTAGGKTYFINNILNYTQFEISQDATATEGSGSGTSGDPYVGVATEFSTLSSPVNTTTLITDNANKVPPGLNEVTPVQQSYSTSDVQLIPRYAFSNKWSVTSGDPYNTTNIASMPIFPGTQFSKVQSIGNFENLFPRASYNGLYNADADPPTATIENQFDIGQRSELAKPTAEKETIAALYETTPVKSELDIYYETSTSGTVNDLNSLVRDNLIVPQLLVKYPDNSAANFVGGTDIGIISVDESLDFTTTPTLQKFQIVDSEGGLITYTNAEKFGITTALYGDGASVSGTPYTVSQSADATEQGNSVYLIKATANNSFYNGSNANQNVIDFNITFDFLQFGVLPINYSIPVETNVQNIAPLKNTAFVNQPTVEYVFFPGDGADPAPRQPSSVPGAPSTWTNTNGNNTSLSQSTNGGNANNVSAGEELSWSIWIDANNNGVYVNATQNPIQDLDLTISVPTTNSPNAKTQRVFNVGQISSTYRNTSIGVQIKAIDQNGNGLATVVSSFKVRIITPSYKLLKYRDGTVTSGANYPWFLLYNGGDFNVPFPSPLPPSGAQYGSGQGMAGIMTSSTGDITLTSVGTGFNIGDIIGATTGNFTGSINPLYTVQLDT